MAEFSQSKETKVDEYRKRFVRIVEYQEEDIEDLTDEVISRTNLLVKKKSNDESGLISGLSPILAFWGASMIALMLKNNISTAEIVSDQQREIISDKYHSAEFNRMMDKEAKNLATNISKSLVNRKFPGDNLSIGSRIKSIEGSSRKTMIDIVTVGIANGKSAKDIASDLDNFIKPAPDKRWVGPFEWYREKFGYKVKIVPKGRAVGSLHYNSVRIARTEINNTYRQSVIQLNKGKPWVLGWKWNLSPAHPAIDICDDWAAKSIYKDENEISGLGHPHCMCYITTVLASGDEVE